MLVPKCTILKKSFRKCMEMAILGTACMADKVHKHGEHIQ